MNAISIESVPQIWNDQDEQFFRIAAALFSSDFCYGAGVLLASYDDEACSRSDSFAATSDVVAVGVPCKPVRA